MIPLINSHYQPIFHPHYEIHNSVEVEFLSGGFERRQIVRESSDVPRTHRTFYRLRATIVGQKVLRQGALIQLQAGKSFDDFSFEVRMGGTPELKVFFEALLAAADEPESVVGVCCIGCIYACPDSWISLRPGGCPLLADLARLRDRYYER